MFYLALLLGLVTMSLLAAEAFSSRRMNRSLWRDGFMITVTHERLGIGRTPSEIEGRPAHPWRAEIWVHGEDGQLPRSLPFVKGRLKLPPPARVHLLDGSLYSHAGPADPADRRALDGVVRTMVAYAKELSAASRRLRGQAFEQAMLIGTKPEQRLTALDLLLTHFPSSLEADVAAKDALLDPHPAVRLRAARALADAGSPVAQAVLLDEDAPADVRRDALSFLSTVAPRTFLVPLIVNAVRAEARVLQVEGQRLAGQLKVVDAVPDLLKALRAAGPDDRSWLLSVLGRIGDARVEPLALANLEHEETDVCREAVRCLARVSRPETVVPLLSAWLRARPRPEPVRALAETVVNALGRPVDGRGRLSLVIDDSIGAVSMPASTGALAIGDRAAE